METMWIAHETHLTIFRRIRTILWLFIHRTITQKVEEESLGFRIKTGKRDDKRDEQKLMEHKNCITER